MYTYKEANGKYILSIDNHTEITAAFTAFCQDKQISCGVISGIGAVNSATLRFFNPATKEYVDKTFSEQMEIANLTGNISTLDGRIYLHLHCTFGREDYTSLAGHLLVATLSGAGEFFIEPLDADAPRAFSEEIGLNVYDF